MQLVSSEAITATRSSNVTFKHCPRLNGPYTGSSGMLEFCPQISSACIHNKARHITLNCLRSQTKYRKEKLTLNQPQKCWKTFAITILRKRGEKFLLEKSPTRSVQTFCVSFSKPLFNNKNNTPRFFFSIIVL